MRYDVVVVGSGFGGSVTAARLAERGMKVLVLERGPWWGPAGEGQAPSVRRAFPRGAMGLRKLLRNVRIARSGRSRQKLMQPDGLFELHAFDSLLVFTGSGVGGGSLVYTSVQEPPADEFFGAFPPEITAEEMRPYYERVRGMLRPSPLPHRVEKNVVFERAAEAAGFGAVTYPNLAIAFGRDPLASERFLNAAGVEQSTCVQRGECILGCPERAKTTLDLTYVPFALARGAELRPLSEVTSIGREEGSYYARWLDHRTGEERVVRAPRLVLAAGTMNTLRLLFAARDRDRTLPRVSPALGSRFFANGDHLSLLFDTGALQGSNYGPAFNAFVRRRADGRVCVLGEVGVPASAFPVPGWLRRKLVRSAFVLGMGCEASPAVVRFEGDALHTDASRDMSAGLYDGIERDVDILSRVYAPRGKWLNLPAGRGARSLATVHPLGGAAIASSSEEGVVDHRGEVFGHPGLYVADGSLYPAAPGVPPSMTIAALAERQAMLMT